MPIKDIPDTALRWARALVGRDVYFPIQVNIPGLKRYGSDYGGWVISPRHIASDSVVYSLGVGEDITFDAALIKHHGVALHAFDPTPRALAWAEKHAPERFHLHAYAIAADDGTITFYPPENPEHVSHTVVPRDTGEGLEVPARCLSSIMSMLGHKHIDLLKMDIEGAEYEVLDDMLDAGLVVRQLLVEFHHRFEQIPTKRTRESIERLNREGFQIFAISPRGEEYSFLHRSCLS